MLRKKRSAAPREGRVIARSLRAMTEKTDVGEADGFEDERGGQSEGRQRGFEMLP